MRPRSASFKIKVIVMRTFTSFFSYSVYGTFYCALFNAFTFVYFLSQLYYSFVAQSKSRTILYSKEMCALGIRRHEASFARVVAFIFLHTSTLLVFFVQV